MWWQQISQTFLDIVEIESHISFYKKCFRHLAQYALRVGDCDTCTIGHAQRENGSLDCHRADFLAAHVDELLFAACQIKTSLAVTMTPVTGSEPFAMKCTVVVLRQEIRAADHIATHTYLTVNAIVQRFSVIIKNLNIHQ